MPLELNPITVKLDTNPNLKTTIDTSNRIGVSMLNEPTNYQARAIGIKGDVGEKGDIGEKGEPGEAGDVGGVGLPIGGEYKQKLVKLSGDDYDVGWVDEDDRMKKIIDEIDVNLMYIGTTQPGNMTSDSTWAIQRVEFIGDDTYIYWANSVNTFSNTWDDRLTYTYG